MEEGAGSKTPKEQGDKVDEQNGEMMDPRPLGGSSEPCRRSHSNIEPKGNPTNDPRPLGPRSNPQAPLQQDSKKPEKQHEHAPWEDPIEEVSIKIQLSKQFKRCCLVNNALNCHFQAEDAATDASNVPGALLSTATDALSTAKDKASSAAAAAKGAATGAYAASRQLVQKYVTNNTNNGSNNKEQQEKVEIISMGPPKDEVDLTPEEQLTRHHVELDPEKLHHYHLSHHGEGPLDQIKHKAVRNYFFVIFSMSTLDIFDTYKQ